MKICKKILLVLLSLALIFTVACSNGNSDENSKVQTTGKLVSSSDADIDHTKVCFEIENYGSFTVETYPEYAPQTVAHFLKLVKSGYYNGTSFEKINHGHSLVSSNNTALSSGECKETVTGEFAANGYSNDLPLTRGTFVLSYLPGEYNTATAQFMILLGDELGLDGKYAGFAKVIENSEVFDKIASSATNENGTPLSPIVMKNVYIKD